MKCSDFHELAAAYALDSLSEEERIACQRHLSDEGPHEGCEGLLERYDSVVDALASTVAPVAVPPACGAPSSCDSVSARMPRHGDRGGWGRLAGAQARAEPAAHARGAAWTAVAAALLGALWSHQTSQEIVQATERQRKQAEQALANNGVQLANVDAARSECAAALAACRVDASPVATPLTARGPRDPVTPMTPAGAQPYRHRALQRKSGVRSYLSSVTPVEGRTTSGGHRAAKRRNPPLPALRRECVSIGEFDARCSRAHAGRLAARSSRQVGAYTPEVVLIAKLSG